jgi:hypothetical protein
MDTNVTITSVKRFFDFDGNEIGYSAVIDDVTRFVPIAEGNREYQLIQEWVAQDGNTIIDTDVPTP